MMAVSPTLEMAKRNSKQRIDPLIEESPALSERISPSRSRDAGNTVLAKEFRGGVLVMTGANSAVGLRSMPVRYLFLDEVDGYPDDVDGEGDAIQLAEARTRTFARRKILIVSTPTVSRVSPIEREFETSDQRRYFVPCPHCGHQQWLRFEQLRWKWGEPETAHYVCESCEDEIQEQHKTRMLEQGEWRATAPDAGQAPESGERGQDRRLSFVSALQPIGLALQGGYRHGLGTGARLRHPAQSVQEHRVGRDLGGEGRGVRLGASTGAACGLSHRLRSHRRPVSGRWRRRTEGHRIEASVWAFGRGMEAWLVEHRVLMGDTARDAVWKRLAELLNETGPMKAVLVYRWPASPSTPVTPPRRPTPSCAACGIDSVPSG
jgi:phage terminase large subunit GpA-like protein